jgi:hypothetical protein
VTGDAALYELDKLEIGVDVRDQLPLLHGSDLDGEELADGRRLTGYPYPLPPCDQGPRLSGG